MLILRGMNALPLISRVPSQNPSWLKYSDTIPPKETSCWNILILS